VFSRFQDSSKQETPNGVFVQEATKTLQDFNKQELPMELYKKGHQNLSSRQDKFQDIQEKPRDTPMRSV